VSLLFLPTIYALLDDLRAGSTRLIRQCPRQSDVSIAGASVAAINVD
jgi:HAE1 family hydrophobic/amphiphilic exporter-1